MSHDDDLDAVLHKLPPLRNRCAICEHMRSIPRFASLYPEPIQAVLRDPLSHNYLCAECAAGHAWINAVRRYSIVLAVRRRMRRVRSVWAVLRVAVNIQGGQ